MSTPPPAAMPATVRVLGKTIRVAAHAKHTLGFDCIGNCDHLAGVINLQAGLCHDQERDTLLHECLHALDWSVKMGLTEEQVHALASALYALLKDNPALFDYLRADEAAQ